MADDQGEPPRAIDHSENQAALATGTRVGKYLITSVLGQGGFAITYRARDVQLDRDVALKEYLPASLAVRVSGATVVPRSTEVGDDFLWGRARFLDEAKTIARLANAPAVVHVHDFLEANGTAYVVMQLVEGETLATLRKREGRLSQSTIEAILYPLLDGLEQVHAAGVVHRDIKPENIIVGRDGAPTLIDFGASRAAIADRTQALTAVFTPIYAAPEQFTSGQQGPWTDIYGLAATLYTCVTGRQSMSATHRIMGGAAMPSAREIAGDKYSGNLLAGIDAGLLLAAEKRPQTIRAWREIFLTGRAASLPSPDGTAVTARTQEPARPIAIIAPPPPVEPVASPPRRKPRLVMAATTVFVLAGVAAAGWWLGRDYFTAPPTSLEMRLEAALATILPTTAPKFREETAAAFVRSKANRALAVAPKFANLRFTAEWPTREIAEERALEKCQQTYDEPCALVAVNELILPADAGGRLPLRDAPRVRYAGPFSLERIPAMRDTDLQRPEIANYAAAPTPKAMALNPWGIITAASGAANQHSVEEQVLQTCRNEMQRLKAVGVGRCHLYAVENRVVLPLRATGPITAAAAPTPPTESMVRAKLLDALAALAPSMQTATRESVVTGYQSAAPHKALVLFPPGSSWRTIGWASAALAEERTLEGCQVRYGGPCLTLAVDDVLQKVDASTPRKAMPRVDYDGLFDPQNIPALTEVVRKRSDVSGYRAVEGAKAAALHPSGRMFVVTGAASQREAEERALSDCNTDPQRNNRDGPCFVYAVANQVVLKKRATAPIAAVTPRKE